MGDVRKANKVRSRESIRFASYIYEKLVVYEESVGAPFGSLLEMRNWLNIRKVPARRGGSWSKTQVRRMLKQAKPKQGRYLEYMIND